MSAADELRRLIGAHVPAEHRDKALGLLGNVVNEERRRGSAGLGAAEHGVGGTVLPGAGNRGTDPGGQGGSLGGGLFGVQAGGNGGDVGGAFAPGGLGAGSWPPVDAGSAGAGGGVGGMAWGGPMASAFGGDGLMGTSPSAWPRGFAGAAGYRSSLPARPCTPARVNLSPWRAPRSPVAVRVGGFLEGCRYTTALLRREGGAIPRPLPCCCGARVAPPPAAHRAERPRAPQVGRRGPAYRRRCRRGDALSRSGEQRSRRV